MIKRDIIKIHDFLTDDKISLINEELLKLDPSLKDEYYYDGGEPLAYFSRVYINNFFKMPNESDILKIIPSNMFTESVYNKIPEQELLLKLIPSSTYSECQYTVYGKGGNFKWHVDSNSISTSHRIANFIYYLNDNFEGGELELSFRTDIDNRNINCIPNPSPDLLIVPKKNTLVIMPSDMWHRVKPVIKGKRKTINGHIGFIRS
jgi:Rps23 Pro-64 3,4-dihydroxylase Tpa1-like proline 4-hydroxylase